MLRTVIESELVCARIDSEVKKNPQIQHLYDGLIWRLARKPESGHLVENPSPYFMAKTYFWGPGGIPASITVIYRYDEKEVHIEQSRVIWRERGSCASR